MMFSVSLVRKLLDIPGVFRTQLSDTSRTGLEVSLEFLIGKVGFVETFLKFPFVLLGDAVVPETANIQPIFVEWHHLTRLQTYFQGSLEKSVVGLGKLGAPKDSAVLDKSPSTACEYTVDLFPCTTGIGIPSSVIHVPPLEQRSSYPDSLRFHLLFSLFISLSL